MSYRLINANALTFNSDGFITQDRILNEPCIYADLPNGMDGNHYVLEPASEYTQDHAINKAHADGYNSALEDIQDETLKLIDKIRKEHNYGMDAVYGGHVIDGINAVLELIDNHISRK